MASADAFLNLAGDRVCRRCYYAERTRVQDQRVEASKHRLGVYDSFALWRHSLLGGMLFLLGGASLLGSIRNGAWGAAAWSAIVFVLGLAVVAIAVAAARRPKY
jgi:hypothetical protein